jgi:hypothetical protein
MVFISGILFSLLSLQRGAVQEQRLSEQQRPEQVLRGSGTNEVSHETFGI